MSKYKQEGVPVEELQELADQVGWKGDLSTLFQKARELNFWPDLGMPKQNPKRPFHVGLTAEPKESLIPNRNAGCLTGVPEHADVTKLKSGELKVTIPSEEQLEKREKERLRGALERLTNMANAETMEDIDKFLDTI